MNERMNLAAGCSLVLALILAGGCDRHRNIPAAQSQAATPLQTTNTPMTVTGCLRAGDAADTFVLTTARAASGEQTATYHLQPGQGVALADHVGKQVEVSGTLTAQQEVTTRSSQRRAGEPTATSGTPTVSTATELDVKRLEVQQVRHVKDSCPDER